MTFAKPEVGKPITLTVAAITDGVDGYKNAEWKFRGTTPAGEDVTTNLSEKSALRQLSRIGLDRASAIGRTLEFGVTKDGVKKYYDINIPQGDLGLPAERSAPTSRAAAATPAPAPAAPAPSPAPASAPVPSDADARKAIIAKEKALMKYALGQAFKIFPEFCTERGFDMKDLTPDATAAAIASVGSALYLGFSARGLGQ